METTVIIDAAVLIGVGFVIPLVLGHWRFAVASTIAAAISMVLTTGLPAAALASVWLALAITVLVVHDHKIPAGFAIVAAAAFTTSRAGLTPFDIHEPIVELTAVHFTYAGVGAFGLAWALNPRRSRLRSTAITLTVLAPSVVALGFLTHHPLPQVGGAVLMSIAALTIAAGQIYETAVDDGHGFRRVLLGISGVAPWIPMGLAVAWAASNYWAVPALSIPAMVRVHGTMNLVFITTGLAARYCGRAGLGCIRADAATPAIPGTPGAPASDGPDRALVR